MKRTMKSLSLLLTALGLFSGLRTQAADQSVAAEKGGEPLCIDAPELAGLNFDLSTGGLPIAPGLETHTVIRSDREHPERHPGLDEAGPLRRFTPFISGASEQMSYPIRH